MTKYMYCMGTATPRPIYIEFNYENYIKFKRSGQTKKSSSKKAPVLIESDKIMVVRGKNPPFLVPSYQEACNGDSGSGQFALTKGKKAVLVAIFRATSNEEFYRDGAGKRQEYPCGTFTWRDKKFRYNYGVSESTTWIENLEWIKMRANIP